MTRDLIGQQLGSYRLVSLLERGGFAEVYLGQHVRLSMQAAIKVLHAHLSDAQIQGFQREAETIAKLAHPHIIRILDFDVSNGIPFLVMDYCPDGTLRQRHPKGTRVPILTVVSYVQQVADALQYAHDQKLIHRDVKPENMLIGRRSDILLSDFGIAATAHDTSSMSTQVPIGTIPYMAPEQIQAQARPASDQYALGIVVYEWLCGERPFEGSYTEIFAKHLMTPPPSLCQKVPTLSPNIEQVVLTALAKDPHQRFGTVAAFATAFKHTCQTKQSLMPTQPNIVSSLPTPTPAPIVPAPSATPIQTWTKEVDIPAILPSLPVTAIADTDIKTEPQPWGAIPPRPKEPSSPRSAPLRRKIEIADIIGWAMAGVTFGMMYGAIGGAILNIIESYIGFIVLGPIGEGVVGAIVNLTILVMFTVLKHPKWPGAKNIPLPVPVGLALGALRFPILGLPATSLLQSTIKGAILEAILGAILITTKLCLTRKYNRIDP